MKAARTYTTLTGRGLMGNTLIWMQELVMEFGDEEVSTALEEHALDVPADKLLGRVRDVMARRRLVEARSTPNELSREQLLGWVRGSFTPIFPVIYDLPRLRLRPWDMPSLRLTPGEAREVEEWAALRRHGTWPSAAEPLSPVPEAPADAAAEKWFEETPHA